MRSSAFHRHRSAILIAAGVALLLLVALAVERFKLFPSLVFAIQRTPGNMPSSMVVPSAEIGRGVPVMSLYVEPDDLYDEKTGILRHTLERGVEWERPVFVSYFDRGQLLFAAEAGIRVHGGKSREFSPVMSYRLFFRKKYGADEFPRALIFTPSREPLTRLVVHNDLRQDKRGMWWHFVNPLAYDIARRLGGITPDTKPALVFLNGQPQGAYVLTEHIVDASFVASRFGHANFTARSAFPMQAWHRQRNPPTLSRADVERSLDLESFTRWFIAVLWCAVTDPVQGLVLKDDTRPDSRWFLVNWDMDHAFQDLYQSARRGSPWEHDTFRTLFRDHDTRTEVIRRLVREDPDYREYFKRALVDAVNHQLTPEFLQERYDYYARTAAAFRVPHTDYLPILQSFLRMRTAALMRRAPEYVGSPGSHRYELTRAGRRRADDRWSGRRQPL